MSQAESLFPSYLQSETQTTGTQNALVSTGTISDVADATTAVMQALDVPAEHYPFVQAVIGAADGRVDWFGCRDATLGKRALGEDTRSTEAVKKWVQRARNAWCAWQNNKGFVLIECDPGGKQGDKFVETKYRAHFLSYVHSCLMIANPALRIEQGRTEAFKIAAWKAMPAELKQTPEIKSRHERFNRPRKDVETEINKDIKMAFTYLRKAVEVVRASGGDPVTLINNHIQAAQELVPNSVHTYNHNNTYGHTGAAVAVAEVGGVDTSVHPPPPVPPDPASITAWDSLEKRLSRPYLRAQENGETQPAPVSSAPVAVEMAARAVEACGVEQYQVTLLNDAAPKGDETAADFETLTGGEFSAYLPALLQRSAKQGRSLIVRPVASNLIQADDLSRATVERVQSFAFMTVETSADNFQAWIALPSDIGTDERGALRRRLLDGLGADRGASGAMRWPGSINFKPGRGQFMVRLVSSNPGRVATVAELETSGMLAPVSPNLRLAPSSKPRANRAPVQWPDYQRCVNEAKRKDDGSADLSDADKNWCILALDRGWQDADTEAKLCELRDKARKRPEYARRTVAYARSVVNSRA